MLKFVVQFVILFLLCRNNKKAKGSWFTSSGFLFGVYSFCAACGVVDLYVDDFSQPFETAYWEPVLLFVSTLIFFLLPFRLFDETKIKVIILPSKAILDFFSTSLIILSFYAIFYYSTTVLKIFAGGNLGEARDELYMGNEFVEAGLVNTIASVSASLYVFELLLFFIYAVIGKNKNRCMLLLIGSISEPLHILAYVGRDGIVFWIFSFIFLFLFFKDFIPQQKLKRISKMFIWIFVGLLIPFFAISIGRFATKNIGTGGSIISYLGQSFVYGPLFWGIDNPPIRHGGGFPLFYSMLGLTPDKSMGLIQIGEWQSWRFSTFITSLYQYLDIIGLYVLCVLSFVLFMAVMRRSVKSLYFAQLFLYLLFFQIYIQGVFYFRQYTRGGNLFILLCVIFYFIFLFLRDEENGIILSRKNNVK